MYGVCAQEGRREDANEEGKKGWDGAEEIMSYFFICW